MRDLNVNRSRYTSLSAMEDYTLPKHLPLIPSPPIASGDRSGTDIVEGLFISANVRILFAPIATYQAHNTCLHSKTVLETLSSTIRNVKLFQK